MLSQFLPPKEFQKTLIFRTFGFWSHREGTEHLYMPLCSIQGCVVGNDPVVPPLPLCDSHKHCPL